MRNSALSSPVSLIKPRQVVREAHELSRYSRRSSKRLIIVHTLLLSSLMFKRSFRHDHSIVSVDLSTRPTVFLFVRNVRGGILCSIQSASQSAWFYTQLCRQYHFLLHLSCYDPCTRNTCDTVLARELQNQFPKETQDPVVHILWNPFRQRLRLSTSSVQHSFSLAMWKTNIVDGATIERASKTRA